MICAPCFNPCQVWPVGMLCKKCFYILELIQMNGDGWAGIERVHRKEESWIYSKAGDVPHG